jgi:DNA-binding winged helix-turn-helix (wHTH) protein
LNDPRRYSVGDLTVDEGQSRVTRAGVDLPLPKLSFDMLVALARAAPNVLSLDALMDQVWQGLVVSPETVSQRVKLLRDALGDDPKDPRYIVGVRGRGYRLCAPVVEIEPTVESASLAALMNWLISNSRLGLNARYLLEGSVQSASGRLRVTARLVDAQSGVDMWSMHFDRAHEESH